MGSGEEWKEAWRPPQDPSVLTSGHGGRKDQSTTREKGGPPCLGACHGCHGCRPRPCPVPRVLSPDPTHLEAQDPEEVALLPPHHVTHCAPLLSPSSWPLPPGTLGSHPFQGQSWRGAPILSLGRGALCGRLRNTAGGTRTPLALLSEAIGWQHLEPSGGRRGRAALSAGQPRWGLCLPRVAC